MQVMGVASLPWARAASASSAVPRSQRLVVASRPSIRKPSVRTQGLAGHNPSSLPLPSCHAGQQPTPSGQERQTATHPQTASPSPAAVDFLRPALRVACAGAFALCLGFLLPGAASAGEVAAGAGASSNPVAGLVSFILHLDKHLAALIQQHGPTSVYGLLFAIVFAETGLVLTPFLPGDSLLFAAGAFAGMGQLDVAILSAVFIVAAIIGDAVNYAVGAKVGKAAVSRGIVSPDHIKKTEKFYDKYGGKTVVLARFVPIVRTFAPFVAGIGSMPYGRFAAYNVGGALLWTFLFVGAGFFFGNLPFVRKNFTLVVLGIVAVSVVPVVYELLAARAEAKAEAEGKGKGGGEGGNGGGSGGKPNFA